MPLSMKHYICSDQTNRMRLRNFHMLSGKVLMSYLHNQCIEILFGYALEAYLTSDNAKSLSVFPLYFGAGVFVMVHFLP